MATVTTDFNVNPYYDDFDEDKGFVRVLFRPSYAVQGRELTQLQTILQKQVSRFGDHIFKDGSKVLGGELTLDTEVSFLKLDTTATASAWAGGIINDTSATVGAGVARAQVSTTTQMQQRTTQAQNERIDGKQEAASGVEPGAMVAVGGRGRIEVCTRWLFC